jgi:hypothetical protein
MNALVHLFRENRAAALMSADMIVVRSSAAPNLNVKRLLQGFLLVLKLRNLRT